MLSQLKQAVIVKKREREEIFKKLKEDEQKFDNQIAESSQRLFLLYEKQESKLKEERNKNQLLSKHLGVNKIIIYI